MRNNRILKLSGSECSLEEFDMEKCVFDATWKEEIREDIYCMLFNFGIYISDHYP